MTLQQIDDLCDEFETAMRKGEPAQIEDYLTRISEEYRPKLLRELLEIEIELISQKDSSGTDAPASLVEIQKSYKKRFPEEAELVDSIVRRIVRLRQIGDYEILEELGHGGMGIVYKARQKLLNQIVAIKVLSQTLLNDPQAVGRFRREMQLIGSLNHPNIVRALNAGETDGTHYLVMEFVDGITLQRLGDNLRKENEREECSKLDETTPSYPLPKPVIDLSSKNLHPVVAAAPIQPIFPVSAACEAVRQAALGLQHAHDYRLVHRDIKPANLMLDRRGIVKILDLGLGKFLPEQRAVDEHSSLTIAGTTIGTIDYIAPEQCENAGDVDIRADLYSLGCTLFFLLTGKPPYTGSRYDTTRKKLMGHIVGEIPKIRKTVTNIPEELEAVLQKALAKEPGERFQTPLEFADALLPFASFDELINLIGGEMPSSIRHLPGSTGRIFGSSNAQQIPRKIKSLSIRLKRGILAGSGVAISVFIGMFFFNSGFWTKNVPTQPIPVSVLTSVSSDQKTAIQTDLTLLPGLNGSWWFDEMPWYLPCVRELLFKKIEETGDLKTVLGDDPEKYYDPNVPAVQDWLWSLFLKFRDELKPTDRELVEKIKAIFDSNAESKDAQKLFQELLNSFLEKHPDNEPWRGVELHARALMEHRLATRRNERELAVVAAKHYNDALEQYRTETRQGTEDGAKPEAVQTGIRSRRLEFLCLSDSARLEYLVSGNYGKAIQRFETVTKIRQTGERIGALFSAELGATHGSLCAEAGQYDDSLFIRAKDSLGRSKAGNRMHPLAAYLAERYAWSLLDQWKVAEAEKQFTDALVTRKANQLESKNPFATIPLLHDLHALALTLRYRGNPDRSIEEYHRTLGILDQELAKFKEGSAATDLTGSIDGLHSGLRRYRINLNERAANTRERLADCTLYGGAASGDFGPARLSEAAKLYEEAAEFYNNSDEGFVRTMRSKQAIILLLQNKIDDAEQILYKLDERKGSLLGNQLRTELTRQVADALILYKKNTENSPDSKKMLRQFLQQFTIPSNPASFDAYRRETLELRMFCAEFLVSNAQNADLDEIDFPALQRDLPFFIQPFGFFLERPGSRPFVRRICDKIIRMEALLCENATDPALKSIPITVIVRLLQGMRVRTDAESTPPASDVVPSLVVFFLTEEPKDGFVVFYSQEEQAGELFRLPFTRKQVKSGTKKPGEEWKLDPKLLELIQAERQAGREISISWNDEPSWTRAEDALTEADWPFGDELKK